MVPYQVTVRRRGPSPLTLTMLVGAPSREHAAGLAAQPGEWEQRVVGFLDQALLGSRR